jgi:hypothetical protein
MGRRLAGADEGVTQSTAGHESEKRGAEPHRWMMKMAALSTMTPCGLDSRAGGGFASSAIHSSISVTVATVPFSSSPPHSHVGP